MEWPPEFFQERNPVFLTERYGIELIFEVGGEVVVHILCEMFGQEADHDTANVRRQETLRVHLDVFTVFQSRDDAGVS